MEDTQVKVKGIETINTDVLKVMKKKHKNLHVGVISLGCDKNRVDTELMLTYLRAGGYKFTADPENADIIIINTCGFIKTARDESMEAINEMSEYRKDPNKRCQRLIVTGCMPQKWSSEMREEFPEVDVFLGIDQYPNILKIINTSFEKGKKIVNVGTTNINPYVRDRMVTTPLHYAFLKIADGCDNYCTFCTIPQIRGRYRSREIDDIFDEATTLVRNGATELIIVAQDITRYGMDKAGKPRLVKLLRRLSAIPNLKWIRLLYCYPELITDELLKEITDNPKICKYIDIPLQHISNNILKRMNRHTSREDILALLERIKNLPVFVAVRTTLMVGFPGETEAEFNELVEFVKSAKLMHVGFFAYSQEEDTPAGAFKDQVDDNVKKKRVLKLMKIQEKIAREVNKKFIGRTLEVIYEGIDYERKLFFGRCQYQTPEADTLVLFKSKVPIEIGKYYKVKITGVRGYDLQGEIVDEN